MYMSRRYRPKFHSTCSSERPFIFDNASHFIFSHSFIVTGQVSTNKNKALTISSKILTQEPPDSYELQPPDTGAIVFSWAQVEDNRMFVYLLR